MFKAFPIEFFSVELVHQFICDGTVRVNEAIPGTGRKQTVDHGKINLPEFNGPPSDRYVE